MTLTGCDTYGGAPSMSEGATGLPVAFLTAGVPVVLGSLWSAEDEGTQQLFTLFYRRVAAGAPPAVAWHEAVVALRGFGGPAFRMPAAWAGYQLILIGEDTYPDTYRLTGGS